MEIQELISKAQTGDSDSMELILRSFKPKVTAICREYFLIGSNFDDILQEGMIGLYKSVKNYEIDKNDNFPRFATLCIHRQIQSAVKQANSKKNMPLNNYFSIDEGDEQGNNSPQIILVTKDRVVEKISLAKEKNSAIIHKIKGALNDVQYKVLCLYLNGYSYNEIADIITISAKKVDNLIQTIKHKLKKLDFET